MMEIEQKIKEAASYIQQNIISFEYASDISGKRNPKLSIFFPIRKVAVSLVIVSRN
mgnify:CR=1 FL=1